MFNPFFINKGPFTIDYLLSFVDIINKNNYKKNIISNIKDLVTSDNNHITFFHSFIHTKMSDKFLEDNVIVCHNLLSNIS